jgi:hypothetical protein
LCNTRRRGISLDEFATLNVTIAGDAAAVEDLRHTPSASLTPTATALYPPPSSRVL